MKNSTWRTCHVCGSREWNIAIGGVPDDLASGGYSVDPLMETRMISRTATRAPTGDAIPADLGRSGWIYTGVTGDTTGCTTCLHHQLPAPAAPYASVTSTLALLAMLANSDHVCRSNWRTARKRSLSILPIAEAEAPLQSA